MAAGSVLVLGALTLTGVYVRNLSNRNYGENIVDFTTLEELERNLLPETEPYEALDMMPVFEHQLPTDDLDYDPFYQETSGSAVQNHTPVSELPDSLIELIGGADPDIHIVQSPVSDDDIGGLVMASEERLPRPNIPEADKEEENEAGETIRQPADSDQSPAPAEPSSSSVPAISTSMQAALTFKDGDNLVWPVVGNVLINYSMDKSTYFPTLRQYRYNPAIIIQANEGDIITAAAGGKVISIFKDPQIGDAVTMELGGGYEITYGQLKNILVSEGSFVAAGDIIAEVASPTKYYSIEGTNVYFKLTKDGSPINPLSKLN